MNARRLVMILLLTCWAAPAAAAGELFDDETLKFLGRVDAARLSLMGVQYKGRIAVLDTVARDLVGQATGDETPDGVDPAVAMLELFFNTGAYLDQAVLYVRERKMRKFVADHLEGADRQRFDQTRRVPPRAIVDQEAAFRLLWAGRATARQCRAAAKVGKLARGLAEIADRPEYRIPLERLSNRFASFMAERVYRPIPEPNQAAWPDAEDLLASDVRDHEALTSLMRAFHGMYRLRRGGDDARSAELATQVDTMVRAAGSAQIARLTTRPADDPDGEFVALGRMLLQMRNAWRKRDAETVNALIGRIDAGGRKLAGAAFPSPTARRFERMYNRTYKGTVIWIAFAVSLVLFIVAASVPARRIWRYLAMAVFVPSTAALVAGFVVRWILSARAWYLPPIMNQFEAVIGSAMLATVLALVLELIWKKNYYALSAAFYATVSLLAGFFLPDKIGAAVKAQHGILESRIMAVHVAVIIVGHALAGMTFVISAVYLIAAAIRGLGGEESPSSPPGLTGAAPVGVLAGIDRCNLIVAQLACWSIALGTILGAYWADFAWARWWGWDRKETWALITTLIYVAVLHARFVTPPRSRGLITACGCVLGCAVMLFNWIVVNYFLPGMHSYA